MKKTFAIIGVLLLMNMVSLPAVAAEQTDTILVVDGVNSKGQVKNKIYLNKLVDKNFNL